MNVPPIIPPKHSESASVTAVDTSDGVGAGKDEFASMIAAIDDDSPTNQDGIDNDTVAPSGSEFATMNPLAPPSEPTSGDVIRSLLADTKSMPMGTSSHGLEIVGNVEAEPTAPTSPISTSGTDATEPVTPTRGPAPAIAPTGTARQGETATKAAPQLGAVALPEGPISLAGVLPEFTTTAIEQRSATSPARQAGRAAGDGAPGVASPLGPNGVPSNGVALNAPLTDMPSSEQGPGLTDIAQDATGPDRASAKASRPDAHSSTAKGPGRSVSTPASGTTAANPAVANAPTDTGATMNVNGLAVDLEVPGSQPWANAAAQASAMAPDAAIAKAPPPSGANAAGAPAQSAMITDTAAAFGGDLRLGSDSVRPAAIEQAFRSHTLQPASEQVAVRISRAVHQNVDRITVNLKPASLGNISVDLEIGPDNRLIAVIAADRPETLELMQRDARALERALNDAGLETDSGSLSFSLRGDGGNGDGTGGKGEDGAGDWSSFAAPDAAAEASAMPVYARSLGAGDGIDIRV